MKREQTYEKLICSFPPFSFIEAIKQQIIPGSSNDSQCGTTANDHERKMSERMNEKRTKEKRSF